MSRACTWFLDLCGTLLKNHGEGMSRQVDDFEPLAGAREFLDALHARGDKIVLVTSRPPSTRQLLEAQLLDAGMYFDELVMGLPKGPRVLINDTDHPMKLMAVTGLVRRNRDWDATKIEVTLKKADQAVESMGLPALPDDSERDVVAGLFAKATGMPVSEFAKARERAKEVGVERAANEAASAMVTRALSQALGVSEDVVKVALADAKAGANGG